jgi:hypothetical protein
MTKKILMLFLYSILFSFILFSLTQDAFAQKKKKKSTPVAPTEQTPASTPVSKESSLIINKFVSDPKLSTYLVITDAEGVGAKIRIQIYNEDGKMRYDKYEILNPFGKLNLNPYKLVNGELMNGSIRIFTEDGKIVGQYWQFYNGQDQGYKNVAIAAYDGKGFTKILCQHFVSDPSIESYIIVSNVEKDKPTVINVKYYDNEGAIIVIQRKVLQPSGCISIEPYKDINKTINGVAVVESEMDNRIAGEYWQLSTGEKYQVALPMEGITRFK